MNFQPGVAAPAVAPAAAAPGVAVPGAYVDIPVSGMRRVCISHNMHDNAWISYFCFNFTSDLIVFLMLENYFS